MTTNQMLSLKKGDKVIITEPGFYYGVVATFERIWARFGHDIDGCRFLARLTGVQTWALTNELLFFPEHIERIKETQ